MVRVAPLFCLLPVLALFACQGERDLGQTCKMTRSSATEGEPPEQIPVDRVANPDLDYVSLGSAECEDLVCVRTAGSQNPEPEGDKARGYCTAPCIENTDCQPDFEGRQGALQCARMLLDQKYLDELKATSPETYERVFGSGASSKYCVKPRAQ